MQSAIEALITSLFFLCLEHTRDVILPLHPMTDLLRDKDAADKRGISSRSVRELKPQ